MSLPSRSQESGTDGSKSIGRHQTHENPARAYRPDRVPVRVGKHFTRAFACLGSVDQPLVRRMTRVELTGW